VITRWVRYFRRYIWQRIRFAWAFAEYDTSVLVIRHDKTQNGRIQFVVAHSWDEKVKGVRYMRDTTRWLFTFMFATREFEEKYAAGLITPDEWNNRIAVNAFVHTQNDGYLYPDIYKELRQMWDVQKTIAEEQNWQAE